MVNKDEPDYVYWGQHQLFDIAANLCSDSFQGLYQYKQEVKEYHKPDFDQVVERARSVGVNAFLFAAGSLEDALSSLALCERTNNAYATVG